MQKLFSTDEVHPQKRFDYWHSVACETIVNHDARPQARPSFHAKIEVGSIADLGIVIFENSPMAVHRTGAQIAKSNNDDLFLCRQSSGQLAIEQESRELVLREGDMTLLDPALPYRGRFSPGSKLLVVKLPRKMLEARLGGTRSAAARVMTACNGEASIASAFVASLPAHVGRLRISTEAMVMDQALDLIAGSLASVTGCSRLSSTATLVLLQVRAAIEARLSDPGLVPQSVAAAVGISVRYANALLARDGMSIFRLILARRLARCRSALEDPTQNHRTISEIAYGWGFSDMTHFSRVFKDAFGFLPSELRVRQPSQPN
jgi:AraC-like DNA-binding protein